MLMTPPSSEGGNVKGVRDTTEKGINSMVHQTEDDLKIILVNVNHCGWA